MTKPDKQYVYKIDDVLAAIELVAAKYEHSSFSWGNSSAQEVVALVDRLSQKYGDLIEAPRLANDIRELETAKMVGGANNCIDQLIRELKQHRIAKINGEIVADN
ncbi:hypothetical protein [Vibrio agarivorans]|uniref:Uncharacterized protein n=1 Tax=Vibrio agarivorans TaxID=153622 RepID=A0ABT7Y7N1_9VIBR|nr:hypothetical protein [Vibrio agarivorans]MDN2484006.1 hypothetical protein [Vibrio agarivorans]